MTDITALRDLLARVEGAKDADREIDYAVFNLFGPDGKTVIGEDFAPRFTGSIDACIALAERVLPGWWWAIERFGGAYPQRGFYQVRIYTILMPQEAELKDLAMGDTPALAFLAAILTALIALEERR